MSEEKKKLLNCPFCNHEGVVAKRGSKFFVTCSSLLCGARGRKDKMLRGAIQTWNKRSPGWMAEGTPDEEFS